MSRQRKTQLSVETADLVLPSGREEENIGHAEMFHHDSKTVMVPMNSKFQYWLYAGVPLDLDGSIAWLPFLRALTRELFLSWVFYSALGAIVGYLAATGGTTHLLNGVIFGLVRFILTAVFLAYRHTRMLPTQLNLALTIAENPHFRIGPIAGFFILLAQGAAMLLAWPTIPALVSTPIGPDWSAGPGGALSTGGALIYYIIVGLVYVLGFQHNQTLELHTYYWKQEGTAMVNFMRLVFIVSGTAGVASTIGWMLGTWDFNPFFGVATCLAAGTCNAPITGAWALRFCAPIVGGLLAWVIQLWTWNQNGIPQVELRNAAKGQAAAQTGVFDSDGNNGTNHSRM